MGNTGSGRINSGDAGKGGKCATENDATRGCRDCRDLYHLERNHGMEVLTASNMLAILTSSIVPSLVVLGFIFIFYIRNHGPFHRGNDDIGKQCRRHSGAINWGLGYFGLTIGLVATASGAGIAQRKIDSGHYDTGLDLRAGDDDELIAIGALYNASMTR